MRIAICDDNPVFLEQAKMMLDNWNSHPTVVITELFEDGDALIQAHTTAPFDIILLDVVMPLLNGIDAAKEIRQNDKTVKLVFLTSSPEFAVESYCVKASNYLLKPVSPERLYQCLDELLQDIRQNSHYITVKSSSAIHRVESSRIEYIEAQNKHILFSLSDGRTIVSGDPLYTFERQLLLADGFFKCSRSYIVNIHQIDTYTAKEIKMRSGCRIPISRTCHREFEAAYFSAIFGKAGELL